MSSSLSLGKALEKPFLNSWACCFLPSAYLYVQSFSAQIFIVHWVLETGRCYNNSIGSKSESIWLLLLHGSLYLMLASGVSFHLQWLSFFAFFSNALQFSLTISGPHDWNSLSAAPLFLTPPPSVHPANLYSSVIHCSPASHGWASEVYGGDSCSFAVCGGRSILDI